jgi:hypothetical protein
MNAESVYCAATEEVLTCPNAYYQGMLSQTRHAREAHR